MRWAFVSFLISSSFLLLLIKKGGHFCSPSLVWDKWGLQFFLFLFDLLDESVWPLLGRFTTVPDFLHLRIMALAVVHWVPKPWKCHSNPFQTNRCQWSVYRLFFDVLFFETFCWLHFVSQVLFKWFLDPTDLAVSRHGCGKRDWTPFYKNVISHS